MKLAALFFLAALPAVDALDFTPIEVKAHGEGGDYTYLRFSDGAKKVSYLPPVTWDYRGGGAQFRLGVPTATAAEIGITVQPLPATLPAEETNLTAFEELSRRALPQGAFKVEIAAAAMGANEIDGHKTVEVILTYSFFGQSVKASHLYLSREKEILRFSVASRPADFESLRKTFHASLHSLAGL